MTDIGYMVWIIATAIMTVAVVTVGTLAAAGVFDRDPRDRTTTRRATDLDTRTSGDSTRPAPAALHHDRAA
jgi:hypothetical protein